MALICVIGLPRSGTTLLGRALAGLPGALYHEEPNPMWRFRNFRRLGHEQFSAADATDEVRRYIRSVLLPDGEEPENRFVIEKTPANCIRTSFLEAVVPEARLIFLFRRGDDIRKSMLKKWLGGIDDNAIRLNDDVPFRTLRAKVAKSRYIHRAEKLHYLGVELSASWSALRRRYPDYWGPRIPGWQKLRGLSPETVVDEIYSHMQGAFETGLSSCGSPNSVVFYEDLVKNPKEELHRALTEVGLAVPDLTPVLAHFRK